jgi:hypothetical protein
LSSRHRHRSRRESPHPRSSPQGRGQFVKGDGLYLQHILDAIEKIESYVAVDRDVFLSTSHWQNAVVRQSKIIAEY